MSELLNADIHRQLEDFMEFMYKYNSMSIDHLKELQDYFSELYRRGQLSSTERYKSYFSHDRFTPPRNFPDAKAIIVVALFSPLMLTNFHLNGRIHEIMSPPESYCTGMTNEMWIKFIEENIIKQPGYRIEGAERIPLKALAVRSGLGRYGRNNICYVDDMGSFISLHGFFTDYEFAEDHWQNAEMMDYCESCSICMDECPCDCIREENFVIDVTRCVSWYNERKGDFPAWMDPNAHNALLGCMKCQMSCPANDQAMEFTGRFEDIAEEDTINILNGTIGETSLESISKIFGPFTEDELEDFRPILKRNLSVLIR